MVIFEVLVTTCFLFALGDSKQTEMLNQYPPRPRFVVATLVSGGSNRHSGQDGYTAGAVSLGGSICTYAKKNQIDCIALITSDVSQQNQHMLIKSGWELLLVLSYEDVCFGFSKFNIWLQLEKYSRVLFMDADVMVMKPTKMLRLLPLSLEKGISFAAACDIFPTDKLNSGVLIVDPNPILFHEIQNEIETVKQDNNKQDFKGDQDLIRLMFPQWWAGGALIDENNLVSINENEFKHIDEEEDNEDDNILNLLNYDILEMNQSDNRWYPKKMKAFLNNDDDDDDRKIDGNIEKQENCSNYLEPGRKLQTKISQSLKTGRLYSSFNSMMIAQTFEVAQMHSIANAIHWTGFKPWSVWMIESNGGMDAVRQAGIGNWGHQHPLYSYHLIWRKFYQAGLNSGAH